MTTLDAVVLGFVEGVTEFLPISSTAHLMLASTLLGLPQGEFVKSFEIAIQLGAILAVVALYWRSFLDFGMLKRILVAFVPAAVVGAVLYPIIKTWLIGNVPLAVGAIFAGGVFLILFERWHVGRPCSEPRPLSYGEALVVGVAQSIAVIPGVSRSAATIVGGLVLGIDRRTIVEFSFLLAVPTMAAATGLDLVKSARHFSQSDVTALAIGLATSFVVAVVAIAWLLRFIKTHGFTSFGVYRVLLALVFLFMHP